MYRIRNWLLASIVLFLTTLAYGATELSEGAGQKTEEAQVVLNTSKGEIVLMLAPGVAPATVSNFIDYVKSSFYNGLVFHRVINDFMIQGGGFSADMKQKPTDAPIRNESQLDQRLENSRGTIAMARTRDPDSATSQFFINLKDNDFLDGTPNKAGYAVFGHVIKGMDIVDSIARVETGNRGLHGDVPVEPVVINKAYVVEESGKLAKDES